MGFAVRARWTLGLMFTVLILAFMGCTNSPGLVRTAADVSEAEALQFLDTIVDAALRGDFDNLYDHAAHPNHCRNDLRQAGDAVPSEAPAVGCTYEAPASTEPEGPRGQVVVVSGRDGAGNLFLTEVFVFRDGDWLLGKNVVWWSGNGYGTDHPAKTPPPPSQREHPCDRNR